MYRYSFSLLMALALLASCAAGANDVVDLGARDCKHGLASPGKGDFALFVFCDDASGTQIGVIYVKAGVGPVESGTEWSNVNRFWQEGSWVVDVSQILWSRSGNYLYVVTGAVFGNKSLYELDVRKRVATKLLDGSDSSGPLRIELVALNQISVGGKFIEMKE